MFRLQLGPRCELAFAAAAVLCRTGAAPITAVALDRLREGLKNNLLFFV